MHNQLPFDMKNYRANHQDGHALIIALCILGLMLVLPLLGHIENTDREHRKEFPIQTCSTIEG